VTGQSPRCPKTPTLRRVSVNAGAATQPALRELHESQWSAVASRRAQVVGSELASTPRSRGLDRTGARIRARRRRVVGIGAESLPRRQVSQISVERDRHARLARTGEHAAETSGGAHDPSTASPGQLHGHLMPVPCSSGGRCSIAARRHTVGSTAAGLRGLGISIGRPARRARQRVDRPQAGDARTASRATSRRWRRIPFAQLGQLGLGRVVDLADDRVSVTVPAGAQRRPQHRPRGARTRSSPSLARGDRSSSSTGSRPRRRPLLVTASGGANTIVNSRARSSANSAASSAARTGTSTPCHLRPMPHFGQRDGNVVGKSARDPALETHDHHACAASDRLFWRRRTTGQESYTKRSDGSRPPAQ
jgi:hypothetical protein